MTQSNKIDLPLGQAVKVGAAYKMDGPPEHDAWTGRVMFVSEPYSAACMDYGLSDEAGSDTVVWISASRLEVLPAGLLQVADDATAAFLKRHGVPGQDPFWAEAIAALKDGAR